MSKAAQGFQNVVCIKHMSISKSGLQHRQRAKGGVWGPVLMFETALAGIDHRHIRLIAGLDGLIVVTGAPGLNDR